MTVKYFAYGALGASIVAAGLAFGSATPAEAACLSARVTGNTATGRLRLLVSAEHPQLVRQRTRPRSPPLQQLELRQGPVHEPAGASVQATLGNARRAVAPATGRAESLAPHRPLVGCTQAYR